MKWLGKRVSRKVRRVKRWANRNGKRIGGWANRNLASVALVVACTSMAAGFWSYSSSLRTTCYDRNRRDALILEGVETIADDLGAGTHTIDPLREALAPRDCEELYPRFPF